MGKHITEAQRYQIEALLQAGHSQKQIADILGKDKSIISRELKRNRMYNGKYKAANAQFFYKQARSNCCKKRKLDDEKLKDFVDKQIGQDKSPEQIAGIMKKQQIVKTVSHETIYQYIWQDKRTGGKLYEHLRNKGRRYRKRGSTKDNRGCIKDRVSIDERPAIVNQKGRFGDLEIDLIMGAKHLQPILSIVERKSGMAWLRKLTDKSAIGVAAKLIEVLAPIKQHIHTITSDNGKEFTLHQIIAARLQSQYFFAHPYHSWERGCNENLNRLVRQYFPKKLDFTTISDEQIMAVQNKINNRERKRLDYLSPIQYLHAHSLTKVAFAT